MDVIHPSADMRQVQSPVGRQGVPVTPPSPLQTDEVPSPGQPAAVEPEQVTPTFEQPAVPAESIAMPDRLSLSDTHEPEVVGEDPLTSPFLPDAKVEKRPLGSPEASGSDELAAEYTPDLEPLVSAEMTTEPVVEPAPVEATEEMDVTESVEAADESGLATDQLPAPDPVSLPDELQQDVVAIESNEVAHEETPVAAASPTDAQPEPAQETPAITTAIAQQYTEEPSTGDQSNGAIFDTSTYHQPLDTHAVKKKSSVLTWVLWVVVLLIVGATAGAAWFYLTTQ
jgi:hypothetical protein